MTTAQEPFLVSADEVVFDKELYPRMKPNDSAIERYRASIGLHPPITVARGRILVDGFHRWQANRREGIAQIAAIDLGNLSDLEIKKEACRRNKGHGLQLETADKRSEAEGFYRAGVHDYEEIAELIGVTVKTAKEYCRDARRDKVHGQKARAQNMWLDGSSFREIGRAINVDHKTVAKWIGETSNPLENSPPASIQYTTWWEFPPTSSPPYLATPPEVLENLLWYFTDHGQMVVDPLAGHGAIIDVAKTMGRRVWAFDMEGDYDAPHLPIHKWNILDGWPKDAPELADLVLLDLTLLDMALLDPPHWMRPDEVMDKESLQAQVAAIVKVCQKHAKRIAWIRSSTTTEDFSVVDHLRDMLFAFGKWRVEQRICIPYPEQRWTELQVEFARKNKLQLNLYRDLVVMARPDVATARESDRMTLEIHEAGNEFPMLDAGRFAALVEDIRQHGQRVSIKLYGGKILDGKNRYKACLAAGVIPMTEDLPDDINPWDYVWSMNGPRRNLEDDQRVLVGKYLLQTKPTA